MSPPVVAIVGSRRFPRSQLVRVDRLVEKLALKYPEAVVVSGGAPGVDRRAEIAAEEHGLDLLSYRVVEFISMQHRKLYTIETVTRGLRASEIAVALQRRINPPCFGTFGQAAYRRDVWVAEDCEKMVAFWDGASRGTRHTLDNAERLLRPTWVIRPY